MLRVLFSASQASPLFDWIERAAVFIEMLAVAIIVSAILIALLRYLVDLVLNRERDQLYHKLKISLKNGDVQYRYLDPDYFLEILVVDQSKRRGVETEGEERAVLGSPGAGDGVSTSSSAPGVPPILPLVAQLATSCGVVV